MFYVLLVLNDEARAKDFVSVVLSDDQVTVPVEGGEFDTYPAQVWGVWKKPTRFCACGRKGSRTSAGFRRDPDTGWWVCAVCGNPTEGWASGNQWFSVLGATLLPRAFQPYTDADPNHESKLVWNDLIDE